MNAAGPRIVIIGGGAGGLELATQLGHKLGRKNRAQIILVDRNRTHIWKPLLHEVATGSLDSDLDGVVYSAHAAKHGYQFQLGTFCGLDAEAKQIIMAPIADESGHTILPERQIPYDKLVIAIGSISNDFNTPGVKEHCFFLDSHQQANRFHNALLDSFTRIHQSETIGQLNIAIVGGGATGVELSAELYHVTEMLKIYGLSKMTAEKLNIHLIEAGPRILPALPERIADSARRELIKLGVNVMENTRISEATSEGFVTSEGELIKAHLMLWAAGVKAPDFIKSIGFFELNRANQIMVKPSLLSTVDESIYVIGDCCACQQPNGSFVPPRAQSAHQMAECVEKNLIHELNGEPREAYTYVDHGSLVNLSRYSTVGSLMGNLSKSSMFIEGKIARLVYISLYRMHQRAIHGSVKTFGLWIAEKVMRVVRPRMKLH
ncbi:NAD(P)/FAD-dependent oxidoreductase [Shewanella sp. D64]|uniref:NAD(P)/FAD-dependent oxidoreductase n=1 Tax=unclassified Shewanella TaxID=196818 RepID=UPI0022BA6FA3|nr:MULTISPECIES: NAD(P)/FAD-dependent oxidoreductase [unclassified Shewanella]MEC4724363.1 NAD(P)/FAD-dependent oxidoreductase [Shewanella sp. D64]MEC4738875.1 NAD(P)/FAD-dependent oxidoreductase [Shewanella sp. E94]WBJ97688.1 NAD(P)/FAD-dependent oxidoreductase [Shewanella sp. MTB7]